MRKLTVRLDERDQALPGRADYLQAAPYLLVDILVEGKQGVAQGGDRGDGVHDLMGQDPCQPYPWLDLLIVQLAVDIIDRDDADVFLLERHLGDTDREMYRAPLVDKGDLMFLAGTNVADEAL